MAVVYGATRRKLHLHQESVGVGVLLIVVAHQLQCEEAYDVHRDDGNSHSTQHIAALFEIKVAHLLFLTFSITNIKTTVSTVLPNMLVISCIQLYRLKASSEKKARHINNTSITV